MLAPLYGVIAQGRVERMRHNGRMQVQFLKAFLSCSVFKLLDQSSSDTLASSARGNITCPQLFLIDDDRGEAYDFPALIRHKPELTIGIGVKSRYGLFCHWQRSPMLDNLGRIVTGGRRADGRMMGFKHIARVVRTDGSDNKLTKNLAPAVLLTHELNTERTQ